MENYPDKNRLEKYEQVKDKLKVSSELNDYFMKTEICGKSIHVLNIGDVNFPTGNIIVCDPFVTLTKDAKSYFIKVFTGIFPLIISALDKLHNSWHRLECVDVSKWFRRRRISCVFRIR